MIKRRKKTIDRNERTSEANELSATPVYCEFPNAFAPLVFIATRTLEPSSSAMVSAALAVDAS